MSLLLTLGPKYTFGLAKVQVRKKKALAIQYAALYLKHAGRELGIPVARIADGAEPPAFWKHFS